MITGVVLARNEEANIVHCLRALERHVAEIILIDMESSDRTVELARPFVDKVLTHPLVANFDAARNLAIPEARFDWLWFVDADEWLTDEVGRMVNDVIRQRGDTFEVINIPFMSHFCGQWMRYCGWWPGYTCPRVLKRGHFEFSRTLHGGVKHTGREIRFPAEASAAIPHYSYSSVEHWVRKCNGYTSTEAKQLSERGFQWDWRFANHMMVHDLWEHFEKHRAKEDGDRGWILTWLAAQYRWFSVAKLIDVGRPAPPPNSCQSVPRDLDEVVSAIETELAFFRKGSAKPPLGIVWRSRVLGDTAEALLTRRMVPLLAEEARPVVLEPMDGPLENGPALLRALSRGRRSRHALMIAVNQIDAQPDNSAVFNVLLLTNETQVPPTQFDETWVATESQRTALRRLGGAPERIRVVEFVDCQGIISAVAELEQRLVVQPPPPVVNGQIHLEIEGEFFAGHSFSNINEQIGLRLATDPRLGVSLRRRHGIAKPTEPVGPARGLKSYFDRPLNNGPQVTIRHAFPPNWQRPETGLWVHVQPWEFGHLPPDWLGPLRDQVDEIWAPSRYVEEVYRRSGVAAEKIHYVPWGVDLECFSPDAPALKLPTEKSIRFLYVGGTIWRKGFDRVLEAYLMEFTRDDDVCLVIKDLGGQSFYRNNFTDRITAAQNDPRAPEIIHIESDYTPGQLAGLYTACHCLVAPYRGEGFCLPVLEAMACGLPVIVPRGGPTDDFVTANGGVLLESRLVETKVDAEPLPGKPFTVLEIDPVGLRHALRRLATDHEERAKMSRFARQSAEAFPWSRSVELMAERIEALAGSDVGQRAETNGHPAIPKNSANGHPTTATVAALLELHNDEHRLADLLCRVRPFVDELMVADLGSQDRSATIAREYGATVLTLDHENAGLLEAARETTCDWVFCLSIDQRISQQMAPLREAIHSQPADVVEVALPGPLVLHRRESLLSTLQNAPGAAP